MRLSSIPSINKLRVHSRLFLSPPLKNMPEQITLYSAKVDWSFSAINYNLNHHVCRFAHGLIEYVHIDRSPNLNGIAQIF